MPYDDLARVFLAFDTSFGFIESPPFYVWSVRVWGGQGDMLDALGIISWSGMSHIVNAVMSTVTNS